MAGKPEPKTQTILHIDGDAFFVGVEVAKDPKLAGRPVVTGEERGIVSALSYEAKALGVKRGMPIFRLKKNFPQVIILPGDYASYVEYSEKMFEIVRRYADVVEEYSIDECFAELTGLDRTLKLSYLEIAEKIKKEINAELKLSVSIGLAPTKVLAKVASKWVKPDGLTLIEKENVKSFLDKTPVEKVWGIGPRTSEFLKKKNVKTAGDFVEKSLAWVHSELSKPYETLWRELRGEMVMQVDGEAKTEYSSIQKTRSFHPSTNDKDFLLSQLSKHVEEATRKARYYHLAPKKLSFFLKTANFEYETFNFNLSSASSAPEILIALIEENFGKVYKKGVLYRTAGVTLQNLVKEGVGQADLFGETGRADKFEKIHEVLDKLEEKQGKRMVHLASTHKALKKKDGGTDSDDLEHDQLFL